MSSLMYTFIDGISGPALFCMSRKVATLKVNCVYLLVNGQKNSKSTNWMRSDVRNTIDSLLCCYFYPIFLLLYTNDFKHGLSYTFLRVFELLLWKSLTRHFGLYSNRSNSTFRRVFTSPLDIVYKIVYVRLLIPYSSLMFWGKIPTAHFFDNDQTSQVVATDWRLHMDNYTRCVDTIFPVAL